MNQKAIQDIINAIMSEDNNELFFYRSFIPENPTAIVLTKRMNELLHDFPSSTDTIICFYLYPAIKWILMGQDINAVMDRIMDNADVGITHLVSVQKLIREVADVNTKLNLKDRNSYFEACRNMVKLVDSVVEDMKDYPDEGEKYCTILKLFLGIETNEPYPSPYFINKYAKDAICVVTEHYKEQFEDMLNGILSGRAMADDEANIVYRNIELLLKEYNKIVWQAKHSNDKALQLLACKNAYEMDEITQNDDKYYQASAIVDYIRFIRGAINLVKKFPGAGEDYHKILLAITELKTRSLSDREISYQLGMSTYTYSIKRRRALSVLSAILWGVDRDVFIKLLTDR